LSATYILEGDSAKLTYLLTDEDDVPTNATVVLTVTAPDGTPSNPSPTNPTTGTYKATIAITDDGVWRFKWVATGTLTDTEDGWFTVQAPVGVDLYPDLAEFKARFAIPDTIDDNLIRKAIRSASRAADKYCGRRFYPDTTATARVYRPDTIGRADVDDFHTITGLVIKTDDDDDGVYETTWAAGDYVLEPFNGIVDGESGWPFSKIRSVGTRYFGTWSRRATLQVTAKWGWAASPPDVTEASLLMAGELFKLKDAPFGIAGVGDFGVVRVRQSPHIARLLDPYRRHAVLVA
jgi:hypothetical protein